MTIPSPIQSSISSDLFADDSPDQTQIAQIAANWELSDSTTTASTESILPPALHPTAFTPPLLTALHTLSLLTTNQKDRAHSLLRTYFQARIREASYTGKQSSIYGKLEVCDVEEAIASVRRMRKGLEMETEMLMLGVAAKRKYSIRDEGDMGCGGDDTRMQPQKKVQRIERGVEEVMLNGTCGNYKTARNVSSPPPPPPPKKKEQQRLRLPPIITQPPPPLPPPPLYSLVPSSSYMTPPHHLIQEAQRATHEFNVRRIELERTSVEYNLAKQLYDDAVLKMEWARGQVEEGWRDVFRA
ncbi:hypothetical protein N0V83_000354 [Neocucurbitaria cava]|uniref:Uncharacterized protein n=1 Tax=Neocucurbitaria cava TaxID=798079 RepID=A0A9W9CS23_9PLEO|nr:hypothetical protein N0V83_000354 [Neocucurbitaria cava]